MVSLQVSVALRAAAPDVHVNGMLWAGLPNPVNDSVSGAPVTEKLAASAPLRAQLPMVLVSLPPVPDPPPVGVTVIAPVPVEPAVVTPANATAPPAAGLYARSGGTQALMPSV